MTPLYEQARTLPPDLQALLVSKLPEECLERDDLDDCNAGMVAGFNQYHTEAIQALPKVIKAYNEWLVGEIENVVAKYPPNPQREKLAQKQIKENILTLINNVTN